MAHIFGHQYTHVEAVSEAQCLWSKKTNAERHPHLGCEPLSNLGNCSQVSRVCSSLLTYQKVNAAGHVLGLTF